MTENLATQFVEENGYPMHVFTKWAFVFIHGHVPPEHDRYNIKFLSSSRITCLCRCPVILYCFLCALHFVEMPSSRPTHFVEKNSVPLQFGGARPHQGNFKGDIYVQTTQQRADPMTKPLASCIGPIKRDVWLPTPARNMSRKKGEEKNSGPYRTLWWSLDPL